MFSFLYRLILRGCPADLRAECGTEMEEIARWLATSGHLHARAVGYTRALIDLIAYVVAVRYAPSPSTRRPLMLKQDVRTAVRQIRTGPLFASAVVLMLALGIGASAAIFSVVYGVLLRPLPFPEPDRLVEIWGAVPARAIDQTSLAEANTWDLRDMNQTFAEMGALHDESFSLTDGGEPERLEGAAVSVGFLRALGVTPILGRLFEPGEDNTGAVAERVILSERLWNRRFDAARDIIGKSITLDGRPYQVVGVLPRGPVWLAPNDVFVPFIRRANANRGSWEFAMIGRIKPGVTFDGAVADLKRVARQLESYPHNKGWDIVVNPSNVWIASPELRRMLWIMLWSVLLLLVIASVNVANLLLVRASSRARERAVRTAMGATRADLIREGLTESMLLSGIGMVLGCVAAYGMLKAFKGADPGGIPRLADVALNGWVVAFAAAIATLVGVTTGLVPALQTQFSNIVTALRQGQRGSIGDRRHDRTRAMFVTVEVALSVLLLIGAGLLIRSLTNVLASERGFATERRLLATVTIPSAYSDGRRADVATRILARVGELPEIFSVSAVSGSPLSAGSTGMGFDAADKPAGDSAPWASWRLVTKDYFTTIGLTMVEGRTFTEQDMIDSWRVVISQRLAKQMWPRESAIGRTAVLWKGQGARKGEVIGVVSDMRERGLERDPTFAVYLSTYGALDGTTLQLVMQTRGRAIDAAAPLRAAVSAIDPTLPISAVRSLEDVVTASVATRRFTMFLLATFAGLALLLALAGVAGVLAYSMARRTGEMGIRLALGARHSGLVGLAMRQGLTPVVIGLAAGLGAAYWLSRLMANQLFGVTPTDPITYAVCLGSLAAAAAVACYLPARKALRVDPAQALRAE